MVHLENTDLPLNPHHQEIITSLEGENKEAGLLGLWLGWLANSRYFWFVEPEFDYPADFLLDPRPERVCDPSLVEWDDKGYRDDEDLVGGMIELRTFLIFDFMCRQAEKEYQIKKPIFLTTPPYSMISAGALS